METNTRGREGRPIRFGRGELVLTAMADTLGTDVRSGATEAVVVQRAATLASRTYGEDKLRKREVREALVGAGHGRTRAQWCTMTMVATATA